MSGCVVVCAEVGLEESRRCRAISANEVDFLRAVNKFDFLGISWEQAVIAVPQKLFRSW